MLSRDVALQPPPKLARERQGLQLPKPFTSSSCRRTDQTAHCWKCGRERPLAELQWCGDCDGCQNPDPPEPGEVRGEWFCRGCERWAPHPHPNSMDCDSRQLANEFQAGIGCSCRCCRDQAWQGSGWGISCEGCGRGGWGCNRLQRAPCRDWKWLCNLECKRLIPFSSECGTNRDCQHDQNAARRAAWEAGGRVGPRPPSVDLFQDPAPDCECSCCMCEYCSAKAVNCRCNWSRAPTPPACVPCE